MINLSDNDDNNSKNNDNIDYNIIDNDIMKSVTFFSGQKYITIAFDIYCLISLTTKFAHLFFSSS